MGNRKIIIAVVAAVLLITGVSAGAFIHFYRLNRQAKIEKAKELISQRFGDRGGNQSRDQRRAGWEDMGKQLDSLGISEEDRRNAFMAEGARRYQEEMDNYMKLSEKERRAYMWKKAQEDAARFDKRAADKAKNGDKPGDGQGDRTASNGNSQNGNGQGGQGGRGNRGNWTPEQREAARKKMLDNSTPEQRAQQTIYRQDRAAAVAQMNTLRLQQGIPVIPPRRGWGGSGGF